jgi:hypothetical protein
VPFLNGVQNIGTDGGLTVQGGLSCSDSGTLNTWEAISAGTFGGFTSASLASGSSGSWPSPACPVKEAFNTWPTMFTPVGYDSASDASANYSASDGTSGQPWSSRLVRPPFLRYLTISSSLTAAVRPSAVAAGYWRALVPSIGQRLRIGG